MTRPFRRIDDLGPDELCEVLDLAEAQVVALVRWLQTENRMNAACGLLPHLAGDRATTHG